MVTTRQALKNRRNRPNISCADRAVAGESAGGSCRRCRGGWSRCQVAVDNAGTRTREAPKKPPSDCRSTPSSFNPFAATPSGFRAAFLRLLLFFFTSESLHALLNLFSCLLFRAILKLRGSDTDGVHPVALKHAESHNLIRSNRHHGCPCAFQVALQ